MHIKKKKKKKKAHCADFRVCTVGWELSLVLQGGTRLLTLDFLLFCVLAWPKVLTRLFGPQLPARPPLWLMVSCRGLSRGLWGPQEWQSHRKGRFWVPDLTALMRTAPWPGTPVETLYEWKRNFCCVCLLKQLAYQITILATVLWAALRTFWSLRDNQSNEGHEPPRCWAPLSSVF